MVNNVMSRVFFFQLLFFIKVVKGVSFSLNKSFCFGNY